MLEQNDPTLENIRRFTNFSSLLLFLHFCGFGNVAHYFREEIQSASHTVLYRNI